MITDWLNIDANIWCHPQRNDSWCCFIQPHNSGANYGYADGHVKFKKAEATIDPVWEWIRYNPSDTCGGGDGGWSACMRGRARDYVRLWRQRHPNE
ncbi:MAG: H-X9-DG-CTERM domain-containing protein [Candidatus Zipacnadales bacterium]